MEGPAPEQPAPQSAAASGTYPRPGNRAPGGGRAPRGNRAWGTVAGFGLVSLVTDLVSDGARSLAGPLLGQLGATALVVGLVTGGAEAAAQGLRVVFGPWADRTRRYWSFTVAGYAMTVVSVPLLAVTPGLGAAGLAAASALIVGDRVGKAVRSPAKTVLLAAAAADVGRGRGFAAHKALDLVGALLGPVLVAAVLAATGLLQAAFAVLAVPAGAALALLVWLRRRVPGPGAGPGAAAAPSLFSPVFLRFALGAFFWSAGLVAFGVISFHLSTAVNVPVAVVPLLYAAAMGAAALGALASGYLYDRAGGAVLLVLPVLVALVPFLALSPAAGPALAGVAVWGAATGIQDSTVKALVADIVPAARQGSAYGVFAAFEGAGALAGGALYGAFYPFRPALVATVVALQAVALVLLLAAVSGTRRTPRPSDR